MARVNAKQPVFDDPAVRWLNQLSKSALIDIVVDVLKREHGETEIISEAQVEDFVSPVLNMRGDKMPISAERKETRLEARRAANRRFQRASEIAAKDRKVRTND